MAPPSPPPRLRASPSGSGTGPSARCPGSSDLLAPTSGTSNKIWPLMNETTPSRRTLPPVLSLLPSREQLAAIEEAKGDREAPQRRAGDGAAHLDRVRGPLPLNAHRAAGPLGPSGRQHPEPPV